MVCQQEALQPWQDGCMLVVSAAKSDGSSILLTVTNERKRQQIEQRMCISMNTSITGRVSALALDGNITEHISWCIYKTDAGINMVEYHVDSSTFLMKNSVYCLLEATRP
jgi:hypothetical protein